MLVAWCYLDGRVRLGGGRPTDQERHVEALALHLLRVVDHLVQGRRNQAGEPDDIDAFLPGHFQYPGRWHHDAQVYDFEVVALQHDPDDVLADVVYVALDGRHHHRAVGPADPVFLLLDKRYEVGDGLLHHAGALYHLRQKHLARPEQVPDHVHPVHEGTFYDVQRTLGLLPRLLCVLLHELGYTLDERVLEPPIDRPAPPFLILLVYLRVVPIAILLCQGEQPLGRVGAAIEDNVFDGLPQIFVYLVVDRELACVHDAHGQAGLDSVVQEDGVNGLPHGVVTPEGERDVGDTARGPGVGKAPGDLPHRLDEVDAVVVVLLDAGGDGEHVGVEDDVLWREAHLFREDPVSTAADLDLPLYRVSLARLVEGHDDHRRAVALHHPGLPDELLLALFQAYGVHDGLALHALQPRLDDGAPGRVDHDGHPRDIRLGGHEVEEPDHRFLTVEHPLVHVDVYDLGPVLDLLARHVQGRLVVVVQNKVLEARGASDVGPLADVDEQGISADVARFQPREP